MIPEDHTKVGAVRSLAMTGFTCDEADDVYPYASSFLTELASDPWATPGAQGFAQGALHSGRQITPANPWPEVLMFVYNERHRRWLPVVHPASDTGRLQAASSQMSGGSQGPSSGGWTGGAIPKPDSMVPPTKDTTMSSVNVVADAQLPNSPPRLAPGDPDEPMSQTTTDGTHKMDTADQI